MHCTRTYAQCVRTYLVGLVAEVLDPVSLDGRRAVVAVRFPRQQHARLADLLDVRLRRRAGKRRRLGRAVEDDARVRRRCWYQYKWMVK